MSDCMAGNSNDAPNPPRIAQKTMMVLRLWASVIARAPTAYASRPRTYARLRPIRSAILLPIRMNAAETRASSAIADWTPLAVVSRSLTTAEIDTFISEVSTTRTNIAIARRIASVWSPLDSADVAGTAGALTGRVSGAERGRASPSLDERVARARAGSLRHEEGAPD